MADRLLREGMSGQDVALVRELLANHLPEAAFSAPNPTYFDATLTELVTRFQRLKGLRVDGLVGQETWPALRGLPPPKASGGSSSSSSKPLVPIATSSSSNTTLFIVGALAVGAFLWLRRQ